MSLTLLQKKHVWIIKREHNASNQTSLAVVNGQR